MVGNLGAGRGPQRAEGGGGHRGQRCMYSLRKNILLRVSANRMGCCGCVSPSQEMCQQQGCVRHMGLMTETACTPRAWDTDTKLVFINLNLLIGDNGRGEPQVSDHLS